ncbi:MAG: glycosyltransferase family 4 protein [Candidatus Omnitrophica bacterium]|nr:glycosyltransferase family 4 protein [Candidatus Omnitrophota bacterium]
MNILYTVCPGGGSEIATCMLAKTLSEQGHDVSLLYVTKEKRFQPWTDVGKCHVYETPVQPWHYYVYLALLKRGSVGTALRNMEFSRSFCSKVRSLHKKHRFDLIEALEIFLLPSMVEQIPYTMRLHSTEWTWRKFVGEKMRFADHLEKKLLTWSMNKAHALSSPSRFLGDYIQRSCALRHPIKEIGISVDSDLFVPSGRKDDPPLVLFAGRIEKRKGADIFLKAIPKIKARFPKSSFALIGGSELDVAALALDVPEGTMTIPKIFHRGSIPWFQRASVLVVPSRWDNTPCTILEAMCCETAVVATRVGGIPEIVEDGKTGLLVDPEDVEALTEAVVSLLEDEDRRRQMGKMGREKAVREHDLRVVAEKMMKYYEDALNQRCI